MHKNTRSSLNIWLTLQQTIIIKFTCCFTPSAIGQLCAAPPLIHRGDERWRGEGRGEEGSIRKPNNNVDFDGSPNSRDKEVGTDVKLSHWSLFSQLLLKSLSSYFDVI